MAMGKRPREQQGSFWVAAAALVSSAAHIFYEKLNELLKAHEFDAFVENLCSTFYADKMGRPSIPPGVYFRMLLIGYFEGIDSERGIAWRCADSLSLRRFLGYALDKGTPDHSSMSRTRRLIDLETHREVFTFMLKVLAENGLLDGKTIGADATTLEANAAMRSIVRKETGEGYTEFLEGLAKASGIETPTREDLAKLDKSRKNKASNEDWEHPHDPDAKITKMKDGRTHLAHKAEHAVDMGGQGAVVAVTLQQADQGDTTTLYETVVAATEQLREVVEDRACEKKVSGQWMGEVVTDKGYHSNAVLEDLEEMEIRGYVSEPDRGRRNWKGKPESRDAVYGNRRRVRGSRGKRLLAMRGEKVERSFAHCYETGAMRRTHLRRHGNILKRLLMHVSGFNLGIVMRQWLGAGKPRELKNRLCDLLRALWVLLRLARIAGVACEPVHHPYRPTWTAWLPKLAA